MWVKYYIAFGIDSLSIIDIYISRFTELFKSDSTPHRRSLSAFKVAPILDSQFRRPGLAELKEVGHDDVRLEPLREDVRALLCLGLGLEAIADICMVLLQVCTLALCSLLLF